MLQYEGRITIDDVDISTINRETLRSRIITLTFDPLQLRDTVRHNLMPFRCQYDADGAPLIGDDPVRDILDGLGLWTKILDRGGLNAMLHTVRLSRAEMQLFGIARAGLQHMVTRGRLVLMDEATSALDTATDKLVQGVISQAFPGCTILMIAHRQVTVRDAGKFIELSDGVVTSVRDVSQNASNHGEEARISKDQLAESAGGGTIRQTTPDEGR